MKHVLITAAGSGIALEISKVIAENGYHVSATDLNLDSAKATAQVLKEKIF